MAAILDIFDLQVTAMPIKFQVNWPFVSGEAKNRIFKMATTAAILDFPLLVQEKKQKYRLHTTMNFSIGYNTKK